MDGLQVSATFPGGVAKIGPQFCAFSCLAWKGKIDFMEAFWCQNYFSGGSDLFTYSSSTSAFGRPQGLCFIFKVP